MSWDGYYTLDGAEFANSARFEAYVGAKSWFRPAYGRADLAWVLDTAYSDPATDLAPWYDDDVPASADFYGFYPSRVVGLDDSSRSATPTESTEDGGVPGMVRHASKQPVFAGILAAGSDEALEYGINWFRRTLLGGLCSPRDARKQALGADLVYLGYEPRSDVERAPQAVYDALARRRRKVTVTNGPTVDAKRRLSCGDHVALVQFTVTIGDPFEYGLDRGIFTDYVPETSIEWDPAATAGDDTVLRTYLEDTCPAPVYTPIYDPTCAALVTPPTPPDVPLGCWDAPAEDDEWQRATITIPEQDFPTWTEMLPLLTLVSGAEEVRDIRIRFYRDTDENLDPDADPCAWLSDIVVSYLPPESLMEIDASVGEVHVTVSGGTRRRADSLLFSTSQRPITWPVLECGAQHLLTVESRGSDFPTVDLALTPRAV